MNEPKLKQPTVLGGPCDGGNGYQGCNMVLTYECTQCGRREAADDSQKASLEDKSAFDAAHGYAAKCETDYNAALNDYYAEGTWEAHDRCLRLFNVWLVASRAERPHTATLSHEEGGKDKL